MDEGVVKITDGLGIEQDTVMYYLFISVSLQRCGNVRLTHTNNDANHKQATIFSLPKYSD